MVKFEIKEVRPKKKKKVPKVRGLSGDFRVVKFRGKDIVVPKAQLKPAKKRQRFITPAQADIEAQITRRLPRATKGAPLDTLGAQKKIGNTFRGRPLGARPQLPPAFLD